MHLLLEQHGTEYNDQQWRGVADGRGFGQRQPGQSKEPQTHGRDAYEGPEHMSKRAAGVERAAQLAAPGEIGHDRQNGKEAAEENQFPGRDGLGRLEHGGHDDEGADRQHLERDATQGTAGQ